LLNNTYRTSQPRIIADRALDSQIMMTCTAKNLFGFDQQQQHALFHKSNAMLPIKISRITNKLCNLQKYKASQGERRYRADESTCFVSIGLLLVYQAV